MKNALFALVLAVAAQPAAVRAHHSFASEFDANQPVSLKGTVTKVEFINPHSWIHIEVTQRRRHEGRVGSRRRHAEHAVPQRHQRQHAARRHGDRRRRLQSARRLEQNERPRHHARRRAQGVPLRLGAALVARRARRRLLVSCEHGGNRVPKAVRAAVRGRGRRARDAPRVRLRRARGRARVRPQARRHAVHGDDDAARRRSEPLAGQPQRVLGLYAVAGRRAARARRSRRTTGRIATPSRTPVARAVGAGEAGAARVRAQLHARAARRGPQLRRRLPLRPARAAAKCGSSKRGTRRSAPRRPSSCLRRNYPYRGVSDALVTHLRRRYGGRGYVGMELELNQKHVGSRGWRALVAVLGATLEAAVEHG